MMTDPIRYVQIWSGWLRLAHWLIACGVLFELFSAWTLALGAVDAAFWRDWHVMVGQALATALLLRLLLLFVPGSSHWRALLPGRSQWPAMLQMLKFYLSLARAPLPAWFAHNPLWAPLYLLVLLVLGGELLSGFLHQQPGTWFGQSHADLHAILGQLLAAFSLLHVLAAALHDWKGDGALISALFSGKRYFHVNLQQHIEVPDTQVVVPFVKRNPSTSARETDRDPDCT
jgi:Ni/Fe-hydrogenase 1 B-type cytochrome subunit